MTHRQPLTISIVLLLLVAGSAVFAGQASAQDLVSGDAGFGRQFIRNHPYTLTSPANERINDYSDENTSYSDLGLNTAITWFRNDSQLAGARFINEQGLNSIATTGVTRDREVSDQRIDLLANTPGNVGFFVDDEPSFQDFDEVGSKIDDLRAKYPNKLYLSNAFPSYASEAQLYGPGYNDPAVNYTFEEYLDDFTRIIQPDVLSYDHYPFRSSRRRRPTYFSDLMAVRHEAQDSGIPYIGTLQGFKRNGLRIPSESDIRMQGFTHQAAGYKGLNYFFYNLTGYSTGLVELDNVNGHDQPRSTVIYHRAKRVNPELANLGRALRFLESEAVRFVPGQSVAGNPGTHSAPQGLNDFAPGAGDDPHIQSIEVAGVGDAKDGLIGLLTDDDDQHYFMLTNIYHGGDLTPAEAELTFDIVFDSEVNQLLRLNRETGEQETVNLTANTLNLTLPGGTGDLFKYDTGDFAVPEPTSAAVLSMGAGFILLRRRRRNADA